MKNHYYKITVDGRGIFPIDMLRFGECFPNTNRDAVNIEVAPGDGGFSSRRTVELISYCSEAAAYKTVERFKSFMWKAKAARCD